MIGADGAAFARRGESSPSRCRCKSCRRTWSRPSVAIEDRRFYNHLGIDPLGIARAAWRNLGAGGVREGGSTITQQLAKISFLTADRTLRARRRKR